MRFIAFPRRNPRLNRELASPDGSRSQVGLPIVALVAHDIHDDGGMERVLAELIRRASDRVEFVVVSSTLADDLRPLVQWHRVPVPRRPFPLKFVTFFVAAGAELTRIPADIVHVTGAIVPNRATIATAHFCHAGFIDAVGRLAPATASPARRLNTALTRVLSVAAERWSYRPSRTRLIAAVSPVIGNEIGRHYPGVEVRLTPNGVDLQRFRPDPKARESVRAAKGAAANDVVVLFIGGDWDRKGLQLAIEALALASRQVPKRLVLWVVGRGDAARFTAVADRHGVRDRVKFMGVRLDTERLYAAADIFVLPSLYESFALVAFEAAASGLPVVATPVGGVGELLASCAGGIEVRLHPASIADALRRLALEPSLARTLGQAGRRAAAEYTWDRSADSVVDIYRRFFDAAQRSQDGS